MLKLRDLCIGSVIGCWSLIGLQYETIIKVQGKQYLLKYVGTEYDSTGKPNYEVKPEIVEYEVNPAGVIHK